MNGGGTGQWATMAHPFPVPISEHPCTDRLGGHCGMLGWGTLKCTLKMALSSVTEQAGRDPVGPTDRRDSSDHFLPGTPQGRGVSAARDASPSAAHGGQCLKANWAASLPHLTPFSSASFTTTGRGLFGDPSCASLLTLILTLPLALLSCSPPWGLLLIFSPWKVLQLAPLSQVSPPPPP